MNFLTKEQFENQAFVHFIRTGEAYFYENYLKWKRATEIKSFEEEVEKLKKKYGENDDDDDDLDDLEERLRDWLNQGMPQKPEPQKPEPEEPSKPEEPNSPKDDKEKPNSNKTYCIWNGNSDCPSCAPFIGQTFEITEIPETHPNCKCSCDVIDSNGDYTGDSRKPNPRKPKPKGNCAFVSSPYGDRNPPTKGASSNHKGVDIKAPKGTPIKSISDGIMTHSGLGKSGLDGGLGYFAEVTDSDGVKARYGHMNDMPNIAKGEPVKAGQELGEVGSTGYSSGNHLHFDMKDKNGNYIPPTEKQIQDLLDMLNRNCK